MALTKNDWFKIGKDLGFAGVVPEGSMIPREGCWQREAWDRGLTAGMAAKEDQQRDPPHIPPGMKRTLATVLEERRHEAFANYPTAVREHLRVIAVECDFSDHKRMERIMRTFGRMQKRYGPLLPSTTTA